jgi:hypothetical protein
LLSITNLNAVSLSVELIIISILRPFDGLTKEEFGPFDPVTMCYAHVRNAMSTLWHFRALYTLRNEHWTIQAASACAFQVLFDIEASPIQLEAFIKACRALIELGESFPVAKDVTLDSLLQAEANFNINAVTFPKLSAVP